MLPKASRNKRAAILLTSSLTIIGLAAAPVHAQRRAPAPIVFAGQGGSTSSVPQVQQTTATAQPERLSRRERRRAAREAKRAAEAAAEPTRRVEFRYPDQPDVYYGEDGARADADAAPLSFSSSTSAITQAEAAKFSFEDKPVLTASAPVQADPAITAGGFDARAAAARSAQPAQPAYISAAGPADFSSTPLNVAPTPVPQTASLTNPAPATRPVSGTQFQPQQNATYDKTGTASVFHPVLNGQPTSIGEILDTQAMVAAHPSLPLPSLVQVINLENNREVVVRVNDRGPIDGSGLIELSDRAASVLGFGETGTANVRVRYLGVAPDLPQQAPAQTQTAPAQPAPNPLFAQPARTVTVAAQAPTRSTTPAPTHIGTDQFVVQLASFSDISNAQRLYTSLGTRVSNIGIMPVQVNGTDYFRVVAGPLDNRKAAENLRDLLSNQGIGRGLVIAAP